MSEGLTEEQIAIFKDAFEQMDEYEAGELSLEQIKSVMEMVPMIMNMEETKIQNVMDELKVDPDATGTIDYTEFLAMMTRLIYSHKEKEEFAVEDAKAEGFSEKQIARLKAAFQLLDEDEDDELSLEEIKSLMSSLEMRFEDLDINNIMEELEVDADDSGTIDFSEFLGMATKLLYSKKLKHWFDSYDEDRDGMINAEEFRQVIESLQEDEIQEEWMDELFPLGIGQMTFPEFKVWWNSF